MSYTATHRSHPEGRGRGSYRARSAWFCAGLLLASTAALAAGKPPHAGGPGSGGGGDDGGSCGAGTQAAYAGRAFALESSIEIASLAGLAIGPISDTGELPAAGGMLDERLAELDVGHGTIRAVVLDTAAAGSGNLAASFAQTLGLEVNVLSLLGTEILRLEAGILQATASLKCRNGESALTHQHGANLADVSLSILGHSLDLPLAPKPNTDLLALLPYAVQALVAGEIVLNEQKTVGGRQVVNALRIDIEILSDSLLKLPLASIHLVVSHAETGLACGSTGEPCACELRDWVTGGGWITLPGGARGSFGLVGGNKPNGLQGHLTYIDHRSSGPAIFGDTVTDYAGSDSGTTTRVLTYACTVGGAPDQCAVTVTDNGEPGAGTDGFMLNSSAYAEAGPLLTQGNIQLHMPDSCPVDPGSGGDDDGGGNGKGGKKK